MRSSEYFKGETDWIDWPLRGVSSVRADEHPLSEGRVPLASGTRFIRQFIYLGDRGRTPTQEGQRPFWHQDFPHEEANGPVIDIEELEEVFRSVDEDFQAGAVPLAPAEGEWVDFPREPVVASSTLHVVSGIEIPRDRDDRQLRVTTVYSREVSSRIPAYRGGKYADNLQRRGAPPDSFYHMKGAAVRLDIAERALAITRAGLQLVGDEAVNLAMEVIHAGAEGFVKSIVPHGTLREVLRISRHGTS